MKSIYCTFPLLMAGIVLIVSCQKSDTSQDAKKETAPALPDSAVVFLLKKESANKQLSFPAELIPYEKVELYAKVPRAYRGERAK